MSDQNMKHLEIATSLVKNTKAVDSFQEHRIIVKMRTASIRTVEREQSSLYGEKCSPGGPHTGVDHQDLLAPFFAIERNDRSPL